jgi:hypothetical protein
MHVTAHLPRKQEIAFRIYKKESLLFWKRNEMVVRLYKE